MPTGSSILDMFLIPDMVLSRTRAQCPCVLKLHSKMGIKNYFITYSTRIKRKNELILNVLPEMDDNFTTSNPTFNRYPSSGQEVSSRSGTVSGFNRIAWVSVVVLSVESDLTINLGKALDVTS